MKHRHLYIFLVTTASLLFSCTGGKADGDTYTIVVSLDGFRWDYPQYYETPHLNRIAGKGIHVLAMQPSFPASTFPNHYTLATGLVPDHHGIVNNSFWDVERGVGYAISDSATRNNPAYYGGEPIWITARKQGVKTAALYWIGSDIPLKGMHPDYYKEWADTPRLDFSQRIDTAISWLNKPEKERPQLTMLYIEEPDGTGHRYGPVSRNTGEQVEQLDSLLGVLMAKIGQLPIADRINLIVTSDHGMTAVSADRIVHIADHLDPRWYERIVGNNPSSIFSHTGYRDSILLALDTIEHLAAYRKEEMPPHLQYGTHKNIGDIVVVPDAGWQFTDKRSSSAGAHGYDPQHPDMQVIFYAYGPDFKEGYVHPKRLRNTDLYALLARLLHIRPEPTDGNVEGVLELLRTR